MIPTLLLWSIVILTCAKVYFDIREERPHWEMRAELFTMMIAMIVMVIVAWSLSLVVPPGEMIEVPDPTPIHIA